MIIGVTAAQGGIWQQAQFKKVSSDSLAGNTKKLSLRFGAGGEQAGDLAVIAVTHRSNLTPPDGLTVISQQQVTDASGIVQSLSLFYIKLATADLGRLLDFVQVQEKRMAVAYTVQRPASIASPLTLVAFAESTQANAAAPWPAAPVTATKGGQLVVQAQARVAAATSDMYLVPEQFFAQNQPKGQRLIIGARTVYDKMEQTGQFDLQGGLYPQTSVLSASVVFSVNIPGPAQNLTWQSAGASGTLPTSDITENGKLWRVRADAEPTYWHMARCTTLRLPITGLYFEIKVEEGPAAGAPRSMAIGIARNRQPTTSGSAAPDNIDMFMWFNDGTMIDTSGAFPWPYVQKTAPWGVGDTLGYAVGNWSIGTPIGQRFYINGNFAGELTRTGFGSDPHAAYCAKLGGGGAFRFPDRLTRLPGGCTVWN